MGDKAHSQSLISEQDPENLILLWEKRRLTNLSTGQDSDGCTYDSEVVPSNIN